MRDCTDKMIERLDNLLTIENLEPRDVEMLPMIRGTYRPMRVRDLLDRIDEVVDEIRKDYAERIEEKTGKPFDPAMITAESYNEDPDVRGWVDFGRDHGEVRINDQCLYGSGFIQSDYCAQYPVHGIAIRDILHSVIFTKRLRMSMIGEEESSKIGHPIQLKYLTDEMPTPSLRDVIAAVYQLLASDDLDENDVVYVLGPNGTRIKDDNTVLTSNNYNAHTTTSYCWQLAYDFRIDSGLHKFELGYGDTLQIRYNDQHYMEFVVRADMQPQGMSTIIKNEVDRVMGLKYYREKYTDETFMGGTYTAVSVRDAKLEVAASCVNTLRKEGINLTPRHNISL